MAACSGKDNRRVDDDDDDVTTESVSDATNGDETVVDQTEVTDVVVATPEESAKIVSLLKDYTEWVAEMRDAWYDEDGTFIPGGTMFAQSLNSMLEVRNQLLELQDKMSPEQKAEMARLDSTIKECID